MLSNRNCFKLLVKMISASPIAGCPSFKFLTMQMQPSASCARMWTVLSVTTMFADKPHRLNERTSAQRFCVLTILPPVTALAVGLPAQRAIAQRFRAMALFGRPAGLRNVCLSGKSGRRDCVTRLPSLTLKAHSDDADSSVNVGAARQGPHLGGGGEKGATIVLWKAAICHIPASLTKTRRLSS